MFSGFMANAWAASTVVAALAGAVGFFVVLRGAAFAAHAVPNGAFAGAAGAALLGGSELLGLVTAAVLAALAIGWLAPRGRRDAITALTLTTLLALGAAFLSRTSEYSSQVFSLLFGDLLAVSTGQVAALTVMAAACVATVALLGRPLLLWSALPEVAEAGGLRSRRLEIAFLLVLAVATASTVPVVGALLVFSLMIGPPAAACALSPRPALAAGLSVVLALATAWSSTACSYLSNWPVGFFVGTFSALVYAAGRLAGRWTPAGGSRGSRSPRPP